MKGIKLGEEGQTINPRVGDDNGTLWELEFGNLGFDAGIFKHGLLDLDDLLAITGGVDKRALADIALHRVGCQVDDRLVEFVLRIGSRYQVSNAVDGH